MSFGFLMAKWRDMSCLHLYVGTHFPFFLMQGKIYSRQNSWNRPFQLKRTFSIQIQWAAVTAQRALIRVAPHLKDWWTFLGDLTRRNTYQGLVSFTSCPPTWSDHHSCYKIILRTFQPTILAPDVSNLFFLMSSFLLKFIPQGQSKLGHQPLITIQTIISSFNLFGVSVSHK